MLPKCSLLLFELTSLTLKTSPYFPSRKATSAEALALQIFRKEVYFSLRHMKRQCSGYLRWILEMGKMRYLGMPEKEGESYLARTPGAKKQKPGVLGGIESLGEVVCLKTGCMRSRPRDRCRNISRTNWNISRTNCRGTWMLRLLVLDYTLQANKEPLWIFGKPHLFFAIM